jgi:hypothetical protein
MTKNGWQIIWWKKNKGEERQCPMFVWRGHYPAISPKWWVGEPIFYYWLFWKLEIRRYCHVWPRIISES